MPIKVSTLLVTAVRSVDVTNPAEWLVRRVGTSRGTS